MQNVLLAMLYSSAVLADINGAHISLRSLVKITQINRIYINEIPLYILVLKCSISLLGMISYADFASQCRHS